MRPRAFICPLLALTIWSVTASGADPSRYVQPPDVDVTGLLPAPPEEGSQQQQAEMATLLHWQYSRTTEDVSRCRSEVKMNAFVFADVLGDWFNRRSLPVTADLMAVVESDTHAIFLDAKKQWNRPRPYQADRAIHPCVSLDSTSSYPSGHATNAIVWGTLLSEIFPDQKDRLMARARQIGEDRVIAGVHYPSDVEAGEKLGAEIAKQLLANVDFQVELRRTRAECLAAAPLPSSARAVQPAKMALAESVALLTFCPVR